MALGSHGVDEPRDQRLRGSSPLAKKTVADFKTALSSSSLGTLALSGLISANSHLVLLACASVLDRLGLPAHVAFSTTEYELVRSLVARNLGYSLMIHKPSADVSYEGRRLVYMPITPPPLPVEHAVAVWPEGITPNPRTRELIRVAQKITAQ